MANVDEFEAKTEADAFLSISALQARITDIAKLEGKLDSENAARKSEIAALDSWAKGENDARKTEIENLARTIQFNPSNLQPDKEELQILEHFVYEVVHLNYRTIIITRCPIWSVNTSC